MTRETPRAVAVSFVRVAWVAEDTAVSVRITGGRFVLTTIVNGEVTHERDLSVEDPVALAERAHEVWGKGGEDYAEGVAHIAEALRVLSNAWDAGADGTNNPPWLSTRP